MKTYAIKFDFPDGEWAYGGNYQGAAGFAPTLQSALLFESEERAHAFLTNGYGNSRVYGKVVEVQDRVPFRTLI